MTTDTTSSASGLQRHLPSALQLHILSLLPPHARAVSGRLVSPEAAVLLSGASHCTASLSQPLPPHAVPWAVEAGQQHVRQLPFQHKLQLLCTAAASGSEVNLEVALALLQSSIFPELLDTYDTVWASEHVPPEANPGVAAIKAGYPQLLGWLLRHCPGLVERRQVLTAAAKYSDLAGLQAAFRVFSVNPAGQGWILDWVAESATPDAVAKMEWLMTISGELFHPQETTAVAAAYSGDLGRLRWLRERGCPMGGLGVLQSALQHADLAVAQWLVDEAGCELPGADTDDNNDGDEDGHGLLLDEHQVGWGSLLEASARSSDGLAKVGWLQQRRDAPLQASHWQRIAMAAAKEGGVEMVQYALPLLGPGAVPDGLAHAAVQSGSVPVVQFLRDAGVAFDREAYLLAARMGRLGRTGGLAMVRWLACEAGVSAEGLDLHRVVTRWPRGPTAATSRELLQAVHLLVEKAGWRGWGTTPDLVPAAVRRGDLPLVQYLLQQRPMDQPYWSMGVTPEAAAAGGCEALLEWLAQAYPGCLRMFPTGPSPYKVAAAAGDLGTLTALRRLRVPWVADDVMARVVRCKGYAPAALLWLVENGTPVGCRKDVQQAFDELEDETTGV